MKRSILILFVLAALLLVACSPAAETPAIAATATAVPEPVQEEPSEAAIRTAILLSPGLDYRGVTTEDRLPDYGERPLLIVASENDTYAADSSRTLVETAVGETQLQMYETVGHGTRMFAPEPGLMPLILDWLAQHLAN